MMKENKQEIKKEWMDKGPEWCAEKLWEARNNLTKLRNELRSARCRVWSDNVMDFHSRHFLKEANENLAAVLEHNGIRPTPLRVTYIGRDTDFCENCDDPFCIDCEEGLEKRTESMSFYTYFLADDKLSGITSKFEYVKNLDVIKITDERTGEIIAEWSFEGGDDE